LVEGLKRALKKVDRGEKKPGESDEKPGFVGGTG